MRKKIREKGKIFLCKKGGKSKLSRAHFSWFENIFRLSKYNMMTIKQIREKFLKRFNLAENFITSSGLRKALRKKMKLTWKKVSLYKKSQMEERIIISRKEYIKKILPHIMNEGNLVFMDECSFNLNLNRKMGWNISNKRIYMAEAKKKHKLFSYSCNNTRKTCCLYDFKRFYYDRDIFPFY